MSDHRSTPFVADLSDRLVTREAHDGLSPAVRSVVVDAVEPRAQSLPLALVRATAEAVPGGVDPGGALLDAGTALVSLGGYARIRAELLDPDADPTASERTTLLLASDYLHASAHGAVAAATTGSQRRLECLRVVTAGSSALSKTLFETDSDGTDRPSDGPETAEPTGIGGVSSPTAALAGTGSALGAAVVGASREVVDAMATYGESLVAASEAADEPASLEPVERVLTGRDEVIGVAGGLGSDRDGRDPADPAAMHLERARRALEAVPASAARERLEAATAVPTVVGDLPATE